MLGHQIAVSLNIFYNCIFFGHDFLTSKYSVVGVNASLFVLTGSENDHWICRATCKETMKT